MTLADAMDTALSILGRPHFPPFFLLSLLLLLSTVVLPIAYILSQRRLPKGAPTLDKEGWPLIGPLRFWTDRRRYMRDAAARSRTGNWTFWAGQWLVVGVSGESGQKAFFEGRGLDVGAGFSALFAGNVSQSWDERDPHLKRGSDAFFMNHVHLVLRTENLKKNMPTFRSDVLEAYNALPAEGDFDSFKLIYRVTWRLAVRMVGPEDIANDPVQLYEALDLLDAIDRSYSASQILFPQLPHPAKRYREKAGIRFFTMLAAVAEARKVSGEKKDDSFQLLLDQGDYLQNTIMFVMGALYAAQLNTGVNAATVICYLGANPEWQQKVREELQAVAKEHARNVDAPLVEQLDDLPMDVWESGLPVLYACEKDSIRLQTIGGFFRRNITDREVPIPSPDGTVQEYIPSGACVAFNYADVHADPGIYPEPDKWNPGRYLQGVEAGKAPGANEAYYREIHWGAGRHPCGGMRLAKLEMNIACAYFVAMFDWELTDETGVKLFDVESSFDKWAVSKPSKAHRIRYRKREGKKA